MDYCLTELFFFFFVKKNQKSFSIYLVSHTKKSLCVCVHVHVWNAFLIRISNVDFSTVHQQIFGEGYTESIS